MKWLPKTRVALLGRRLEFPDPRGADSEGLVAVGGDLSAARLLLAYRSGLFPWTAKPVTWWSPDPRGIIELDAFRPPRSLLKLIRKGLFEVTVDRAFEQVMSGCAKFSLARGESWVTQEFIAGYTELHRLGHAHSVECWHQGELAGGIYGVHIGGFFAGESMFYRVPNASKVALFELVRLLERKRFELLDVQILNPLTESLGGSNIERDQYLQRLEKALRQPCTFESKA